jgi:hypothetical protein
MKNRNLSFNELYALERRARVERAKEVARLLAALGRRIGKMVPPISLGRKAVPNA